MNIYDSIETRVTFEDEFTKDATLTLSDALTPYNCADIDNPDIAIDKIGRMFGRLLATLVVKKHISIDDAKDILEEYTDITPVGDDND